MRLDHHNEKKNFIPYETKGINCCHFIRRQTNQHLNANMAFGRTVFIVGLHHRISYVSYELVLVSFLYLWEAVKVSSITKRMGKAGI